VKARCWFEEEPRVDFIRNIAPWDADDLELIAAEDCDWTLSGR